MRYVVFLLALTARAELPEDPDTEIARRHFETGKALYDAGRYEGAVREFEAARKAKPLPAFDYNIARCHDRLEHPREAVDAYQRYLAGAPGAADAGEVRARVEVLRQRGPVPPPSSLPFGPRRRVATWVVGGAGVAVLGASLVAGVVAHTRYSDLVGRCASDGACDVSRVPDAQAVLDSGQRAALATDVLLGVGLGAVAVGVVLFFVEGRHPPERRAWQLVPAGGVGVAFEVGP